jgi:hypothetical protein
MSNMSYCRFENTCNDLQDCVRALSNSDLEKLSDSEKKFAKRMIKLCKEYLRLTEKEVDA